MRREIKAEAPRGCDGGLWVVIGLWTLTFAWVLHLQEVFYQKSGPFFDSASYYNQLTTVLASVRDQGAAFALAHCWDRTTGVLPWVEAVLIGILHPQPARWMGSLIQAPWILGFVVTLYLYFRRVGGQGKWMAVMLTLPFLLNRGMLYFNRGWSDFAMDLMQYVILGHAFLLYVWATHARRRGMYVLAGFFFGCSCLFRATSAAYIVMAVLPVMVVQGWRQRERWRGLVDHLLLGITAAVVCGWFYIWNARFIFSYYTSSGADAIAHLPWSRSWRHFEFLFTDHLGAAWLLVGLCWLIVWVEAGMRRGGWRALRDLNVTSLWLGLVPAGFLMASGAGLNRFVSLPSMAGVLLFLLFPLSPVAGALSRRVTILMAGLTLLAAVYTLSWSWRIHRWGTPQCQRPSIDQLVDRLENDAAARGMKQVAVAVLHVGNWHDAMLQNMLVYERKGEWREGAITTRNLRWEIKTYWTRPRRDAVQSGDRAALRRSLGSYDYLYVVVPDGVAKLRQARPNTSESWNTERWWGIMERSPLLQLVGEPVTLSAFERVGLYRVNRP